MIGSKLRWYEPEGIFTPEQKFERVLDMESCREIACKKVIYYNNEMREKEIETLWVRKNENRETASLASNWGFYVGMDEIERYYLEQYSEKRSLIGLSRFRTINTPVIYIAEDGNTAQANFLLAGEETHLKSDGTVEGVHIFGRIGADFIREDGEWKIWHWVDLYDWTPKVCELSENEPLFKKPEEEPFHVEFTEGKPTIDMVTHYNCTLAADGWISPPCAHKTYNPDNSNGPDGHPALRTDCVDVNWLGRSEMAKCWGR